MDIKQNNLQEIIHVKVVFARWEASFDVRGKHPVRGTVQIIPETERVGSLCWLAFQSPRKLIACLLFKETHLQG